MGTPKGQQRQGAPEPSDLIKLLVEKDKEIKECLKTGTFFTLLVMDQGENWK